MLTIMLCGASDTSLIRNEFHDVISQFGGEGLHYQSGKIYYINRTTSSWEENSRASVKAADLCVFVVFKQYGEITWTEELDEALQLGTPFLVLCLDETYNQYLSVFQLIGDLSAIADNPQVALLERLRELEAGRLTIVPYRNGYFALALREQLALLFEQALNVLAEESRRRVLLRRLQPNIGALSDAEVKGVKKIATDELEDKNVRKLAIDALARHSACDPATLVELLSSSEQGVQRLAIARLNELHTDRPASADLLTSVVEIANESDDVGVARRLIPAMLDLDLERAVDALAYLDLTEIGARRRLARALENHEAEIVRAALQDAVRVLLDRCLESSDEKGWKARATEMRNRLTPDGPVSGSA